MKEKNYWGNNIHSFAHRHTQQWTEYPWAHESIPARKPSEALPEPAGGRLQQSAWLPGSQSRANLADSVQVLVRIWVLHRAHSHLLSYVWFIAHEHFHFCSNPHVLKQADKKGGAKEKESKLPHTRSGHVLLLELAQPHLLGELGKSHGALWDCLSPCLWNVHHNFLSTPHGCCEE